MASRAEGFFNAIMSAPDPAAYIDMELIKKTIPESEVLDYKNGAKLKADRVPDLWAKCLSGFGNNGGGVTIFGVDCRKTDVPDANGVVRRLDVPTHTPALHPDPHTLTLKLREFLRDATEPSVTGVRIEPVVVQGGAEGYVVCFVPSGNDKPYQHAADGRFYLRVQDGFNPMSRSLLSSLFYPKSSPVPKIWLTHQMNNATMFSLTGHIKNIGAATAREILIEYWTNLQFDVIGHVVGRGAFRFVPVGGDRGESESLRVLHPQHEAEFFQAPWILDGPNSYPIDDSFPCWFSFIVYMTDRPARYFSLNFPVHHLATSNAVIAKEHPYDPSKPIDRQADFPNSLPVQRRRR